MNHTETPGWPNSLKIANRQRDMRTLSEIGGRWNKWDFKRTLQ